MLPSVAGEDDGDQNIWDALLKLHVQRIDHGCRAAESPDLLKYLSEHKIPCAMCPYSNINSRAAKISKNIRF